jgi:preprotein translocase subunit SecB
MSTDRNRNQKIPKDYKKAVPKINLVDIIFQSGSWEIFREKLGSENHIDLNFDTEELEQDSFHTIFKQKFYVKVTAKELKEPAVTIKCDIIVICESKTEISPEFWEAYKQISLPVITVPYFREFVYSISVKMGIPPIVVPHWVR